MTRYNPEGTSPLVAAGLVRIERRLPYPGDVLFSPGRRVEPEDIVATTLIPASPHIINVAQALGIPPGDVPRAMRREKGARISAGDVLARSGSLFRRRCVAPVGGEITDIDSATGYITIVPDPVEQELAAAVRGLVTEVFPNRGVAIETLAAQVYGAFGLGPDHNGVLRLIATDPGDIVQPEQIDTRSAYAIIIGGATISAAALRRAVLEQVRGVIVGGIEEHELRQFLEWSGVQAWRQALPAWSLPDTRVTAGLTLTLVLTEGFGIRPMNQAIFGLLSSLDRQEALIEGRTSLRAPLRRPRVIVPLSRGTPAELPHPVARPGAVVRLLDDAHLGQTGSIRALSTTPRGLASGAGLPAVNVSLEDGSELWLPRTCVEVLE
ncbi:MAG: hypothetical protein SNJ69_01690 [Chloroflexaceae bacterium]